MKEIREEKGLLIPSDSVEVKCGVLRDRMRAFELTGLMGLDIPAVGKDGYWRQVQRRLRRSIARCAGPARRPHLTKVGRWRPIEHKRKSDIAEFSVAVVFESTNDVSRAVLHTCCVAKHGEAFCRIIGGRSGHDPADALG